MKALKKILTAVLALALAAGAALCAVPASAGAAFKDITLQPGADETRMNVCWQSTAGTSPVVQVAAGGAEGAAFPSGAESFGGTASPSSKGYYANNVTITGLEPGTSYVYRVGNGSVWSGAYAFKTGGSSRYGALFVSDAQIGASGSVTADRTGWEKTLSAMLGKFPDTSFLLSAGDQVDYYLESEYDAFLDSPLLRRYPVATAVGNHESLGKSALHSYYYNEPNESATYGRTPAGGDYWFRYGNTLYIVLNTNNTNVSEHDAFMAQAKKANADAVWTVLMFHQSVYSSAAHSTVSAIVTLRKNLVPVIDKYDVDVVLSGHDHCYTRSYQMLGGRPAAQQAVSQGVAVNPAGTVYITAGSGSGSKYYDLKKTPEAYAAVRIQPDAPTFTDIEVTDTSFTMTTYRADTLAVIDTYSIVKRAASGFADVPDSAWYSAAVAYLSGRRIVDGTSPGLFSPDMLLTRAQCLVFIMKSYGLAPDTDLTGNFSDAGGAWYAGYLAAAKRQGLVSGGGDNRFMPDAEMARQDMFTLIYNTLVFMGKLPAMGSAPLFSDADAIAAYAVTPVNALAAAGVISGSGGKISPAGLSTRAQTAQLLYKLIAAD